MLSFIFLCDWSLIGLLCCVVLCCVVCVIGVNVFAGTTSEAVLDNSGASQDQK